MAKAHAHKRKQPPASSAKSTVAPSRYRLVVRKRRIDVSAAEFEAFVTAKNGLLVALAIEEKLSLFLENYAEFEEALLKIGLQRLVFPDFEWHSVQDDRHLVDRRLFNLLSAARLYRDQVKEDDATALYGKGSALKNAFVTEWKSAEASSFGFRLMEQFRNHAQHHNLPTRSVVYAHDIESDTRGRLRLEVVIDQSRIPGDSWFKKPVAAELKSLGENVSLTHYVREYVEGLTKIHEKLRGAMATDVQRWEQTIQSMAQRAAELAEAPNWPAFIEALSADGQVLAEHHIVTDVVERRRVFVRRMQTLPNFPKRHVSGIAFQPGEPER